MMPDGERPVMDVVIENIERYRKTKEFTRGELCKITGYQIYKYKQVVKREVGMSLPVIQRFAKVLGVKTIDLIEDWT